MVGLELFPILIETRRELKNRREFDKKSVKVCGEISHSSTFTMATGIRFETTNKGKRCIFDDNNYQYLFNNGSTNVNNWLCATKSCNARIRTSASTDQLLNENLPEHEHGNNLLKEITKNTEKRLIDQLAEVPGVTTKTALCEINRNIAMNHGQGMVSSQRSTAAVKMAHDLSMSDR